MKTFDSVLFFFFFSSNPSMLSTTMTDGLVWIKIGEAEVQAIWDYWFIFPFAFEQ